jgi:tRNA(Ile)-lysidine synthase
VLTWTGPKPGSDIEAAARAARYGLMGAWCAARGIRALYVGHTLEDQAETFLLRLARGSGIDGLSAMRARAPYPLAGHDDLVLARPLLDFPRAELRAFLQARQQDWLEDPMNADPRFARVKLRQAWPELTALGLLPGRVAAAAGHLARARTALESMSDAWLKDHVRYETGRAIVDGAAFARVPAEIGLRALAHILGQVSGQTYRPRFERLERLYAALAAGQLRAARTLHGCRIGPAARRDARFGAGTLTILRERGRAGRGTDLGQPA